MSRYTVQPHRYEYTSDDGVLQAGEFEGGVVDTASLAAGQREWLERYAVQMGLAVPATEESQ